jgi:hypothetical protein
MSGANSVATADSSGLGFRVFRLGMSTVLEGAEVAGRRAAESRVNIVRR